jgi:hypothetical protein
VIDASGALAGKVQRSVRIKATTTLRQRAAQ